MTILVYCSLILLSLQQQVEYKVISDIKTTYIKKFLYVVIFYFTASVGISYFAIKFNAFSHGEKTWVLKSHTKSMMWIKLLDKFSYDLFVIVVVIGEKNCGKASRNTRSNRKTKFVVFRLPYFFFKTSNSLVNIVSRYYIKETPNWIRNVKEKCRIRSPFLFYLHDLCWSRYMKLNVFFIRVFRT